MAKPTKTLTTTNTAVAAPLSESVFTDAVQGNHFGRDDIAIPFLRVAQKTSDEVNTRHAKHIAGIATGDFFNTVTRERYSGEDGVLVVPCAYTRSYIEWVPRKAGGGFVKDHGADAGILKQTSRNADGRDELTNGNEIVTSGLYYVFVLNPTTGVPEQVALSLSGTQLKKSRQWNSLIQSVKIQHPATGEYITPLMYFNVFKLTTIPESNDKGDWMGLKVEPAGNVFQQPNGLALYHSAGEFAKLVRAGQVTLKQDEDDEEIIDVNLDDVL
jgi:hypothetical protein